MISAKPILPNPTSLKTTLANPILPNPTSLETTSANSILPNPLVKSANLHWKRELADAQNFLIAIDESLGSFVNVSVLGHADIVVSNPQLDQYARKLETITYPPAYFNSLATDATPHSWHSEDVIYPWCSSHTFRQQIVRVDLNAE
ncbi:hypothetical protein BC938DRAFT_477351, partial [Jimgerdemannia flammicorona]